MFCALLDHTARGPWPSLQWVEVQTSFQIPTVCLIGLPGPAVGEARERVRSAIEACGFKFPKRRLVINLSPADTRKHSTGVDLAIALSILLPKHDGAVAAWGELGLNGDVKSAGQCARAMVAAADAEVSLLILSKADRTEALKIGAWLALHYPSVCNLRVAFAATVREAYEKAHGREGVLLRELSHPTTPSEPASTPPLPMSPGLIRILMASIVSRHHLLLLGPKGTGKSTALEAAEQLLPEVPGSVRVRNRMLAELEDPHPPCLQDSKAPVLRLGSEVRPQALLGRVSASGRWSRPGELTRAHGGVLVAHEFLEWSRDSREILREPLETKRVFLTRAAGSISAPADFMFWASSNMCPCGEALCRCSPGVRTRYLARLSGPLLDRIDLSYILQNQTERRFVDIPQAQAQVRAAQDLLMGHYGGLSTQIPLGDIEKITERLAPTSPSNDSQNLRSRHALTKVALTLCALDGRATPEPCHYDEARVLRTEFLRSSFDPQHLG